MLASMCTRLAPNDRLWRLAVPAMTAGPQFHIYPYPDLVGLSYGDVFLAFPDAIVVGVTSDHKGLERSYNTSIIRSKRKVFLNPPDDYRLQQGQCLPGHRRIHLAVRAAATAKCF